ncbi:MAG TPA: VOC family protein [Terracidiphilus sp.]|nr:VOC family protein [Terracidiphilus sp.]
MAKESILCASRLMAFVPTTQPERAKSFFEETLGLRLVSDERPFALVFDANGTMLRVTVVKEHTPAPFTVLGWQVVAIEAVVERLAAAGVDCIRYPGMNDGDPHGIWNSPGGAQVAWFHDPDGNVLSVTEFPS